MDKNQSRICSMQKKFDSQINKFYRFSLFPEKTVFDEIMNNHKIRTEIGEFFDFWESACVFEYGNNWKMSNSMIKYHTQKHNENIENITNLIFKNPTINLVKKSWLMFFATGKFKFLKISVECMGNASMKWNTKMRIFNDYMEYKTLYVDTIDLIKSEYDDFMNYVHLEPIQAFETMEKILSDTEKELNRNTTSDKNVNTDNFEIFKVIHDKSVLNYNNPHPSTEAKQLFDSIVIE